MINCFNKKPDAVARLVCFPWAGGGSTHYARWGRVFVGSVEGTGEGGGGEVDGGGRGAGGEGDGVGVW